LENIFDFVSLSDVRVFVFVVTLIRVNTKTVVWQEDLANPETVAFGLLARRPQFDKDERENDLSNTYPQATNKLNK